MTSKTHLTKHKCQDFFLLKRTVSRLDKFDQQVDAFWHFKLKHNKDKKRV